MGARAARFGGRTVLVALAVITLAGLGLRIGYAVDQPYAQPPDAGAYDRIAESLSDGGSFDARPPGVAREVQPSSSYAPGLPLLVAAVYWVSGGGHLTLVLVLLAILGAAAIPLTFLLGRRLGGPAAGLIGAAVVAGYPALIEYQALLLTEPLAAFLLVGSLVMYFRAAEIEAPPPLLPGRAKESDMDGPSLPRPGAAWFLTGLLLGLFAMVRPEYLALALVLPLIWLAREALRGRLGRPALLAVGVSLLGTILVIAPWTIRNAVVLDRTVPISTGGGKALFIGTNLDADGDGPKLREALLDERPALRRRLERSGPVDDPENLALERVLARVAAESYPGLETDAALGRLGRQNLEDDLTDEPVRFAGMLVDKGYETWTDAARETMEREPWRALQIAVVVLSLLGLGVLALRRRFEAVPLAIVLAYMTAVGALLIASPRRELVVLPVLAALAGAALTAGADSLARWRS